MKNLTVALIQFQAEATNVPFDAANPHYKNKYASLAGIIDHVRPLLHKHGMAVTQLVNRESVTTMLVHESGESLSAETAILCREPNNPQAYGSAITYARRYALTAILGISSDDDDDGNAAAQKTNAITPNSTTKPIASTNTPTAQQKPTPAQLAVENGPLKFKKKMENGTFEYVTVDKLSPTQLKWYSNLCQNEAQKEAAQAYIKANYPVDES